MLIGQDVLRLLTVRALKEGRPTWADDRVYDSPAQAADLKIKEEREQPFIGVYTDDSDHDLDGQSLSNADSRIYLLIECAVADAISISPAKPGAGASGAPAGTQTIRLAQTDQALELLIGLISRQVTQALLATDNKWSELWRHMTTPGRIRVEVRRGGPGQQEQSSAIKFASRIMRMQLAIVADPVYGEGVPKGFWQDFFNVAEADGGEMAAVAAIIRAHFETQPGLPSWRVEQKVGTYTRQGLSWLRIAPPRNVWKDEDGPPELTEIIPDSRGGPVLGGDGVDYRGGAR